MVLKKIGLTGASGMVGRHLINLMLKGNISGQLTSRRVPDQPIEPFSWQHWDLCQWKVPQELDQLFPDIQAIIHAGAWVPNERNLSTNKDAHDANVRSCLALAEWTTLKEIPLIFISGAIVYENPYQLNIKEASSYTKGGFGGFYGYSKYLSEQTLEYFRGNGLKLGILRPSSIFGYGMSHEKMIAKFLLMAANDQTIELHPPFNEKINLIHADDVSRALLKMLEKEAWDVLNISAQSEVSVEEIAQTCVRIVDRGRVKLVDSSSSEKTLSPARIRYNLSCQKSREQLAFVPQLSFGQGLTKMWDEMKTTQNFHE